MFCSLDKGQSGLGGLNCLGESAGPFMGSIQAKSASAKFIAEL